MKILYINECINRIDGSSVHARSIIRELQNKGIVLLTIPNKKILNRTFEPGGTYRLELSLPVLYREILVFLKSVLKCIYNIALVSFKIPIFKPDIIMIRTVPYDFLPLFLNFVGVRKIILEVNAPHYIEREMYYKIQYDKSVHLSLMKKIEIVSWKSVDALYVVSNELKEMIEHEVGSCNPIIEVIPNGSDQINIVDVKVNCDIVKIGYSGSFHKWHGVELLVEVARKILKESDRIEFYLIGDGENKKAIENIVNNDSLLKDKIKFTGYLTQKEVLDIMVTMDILVAPYLNMEKFYFSPIKIMEYMACGRAIIASRVGQISQIIQDGVDGVLIPPGSRDDLVIAIKTLVTNPEYRLSLGRMALEKSKEHTWETVASKILLLTNKINEKNNNIQR